MRISKLLFSPPYNDCPRYCVRLLLCVCGSSQVGYHTHSVSLSASFIDEEPQRRESNYHSDALDYKKRKAMCWSSAVLLLESKIAFCTSTRWRAARRRRVFASLKTSTLTDRIVCLSTGASSTSPMTIEKVFELLFLAFLHNSSVFFLCFLAWCNTVVLLDTHPSLFELSRSKRKTIIHNGRTICAFTQFSLVLALRLVWLALSR